MNKCPECGVINEFEPIGPFRAQCSECNALVKNEELVSLEHDTKIQDGDMTGEEKYG